VVSRFTLMNPTRVAHLVLEDPRGLADYRIGSHDGDNQIRLFSPSLRSSGRRTEHRRRARPDVVLDPRRARAPRRRARLLADPDSPAGCAARPPADDQRARGTAGTRQVERLRPGRPSRATRPGAAHSVDRRSVLVALTKDGRALANEVSAHFGADVAAMLGPLPTGDRAVLSSLLSRVLVDYASSRGVNLLAARDRVRD
jgi:hypothetical protein